jgi:hypothetical protein
MGNVLANVALGEVHKDYPLVIHFPSEIYLVRVLDSGFGGSRDAPAFPIRC